jgi:hypothetical protein
VGVGDVQADGGDVLDLLARAWRWLGDVDDVQDLGTAEAGDLHGSMTPRPGPRWTAH